MERMLARGSWASVVVEVRTCEAPSLTAPGSPDLAWAILDAERVAKAMLAQR
jgi:hypothetical protein